ncbi:MAG: hypothetical protein KVP17_000918 [Porospora cf. gigantea B]|uniref:uncharacterized protein n=2 Tax=Porospora cf. gigantea B TaxID=2853592 RepID=UPI00357195C6|nr:MAG: hypothetical protein KVP17_000918 [Porospora cf. gigantea B]
MSKATVHVKRFMTNPLLQRKQFALDVLHPGQKGCSLQEVRDMVTKKYKVAEPNCVVIFGLRTKFGGGRTTGFGLIYDNLLCMKQFEKHYRLARMKVPNLTAPKRANRRAKKDVKTRRKKLRGAAKNKIVVK